MFGDPLILDEKDYNDFNDYIEAQAQAKAYERFMNQRKAEIEAEKRRPYGHYDFEGYWVPRKNAPFNPNGFYDDDGSWVPRPRNESYEQVELNKVYELTPEQPKFSGRTLNEVCEKLDKLIELLSYK